MFFGLIASLYVLRYVVFVDKTAESFGYILGTLFAFFLLPLIPALIVWLISKKNVSVANITFTVMLILVLLSQFSQFINNVNQTAEIQSINSDREHYINELKKTDDPTVIDSLDEEFRNSVKSSFQNLSENATNKENHANSVFWLCLFFGFNFTL